MVLPLKEKLADTQLIKHIQVGGWIGWVGWVGWVGCLLQVVGLVRFASLKEMLGRRPAHRANVRGSVGLAGLVATPRWFGSLGAPLEKLLADAQLTVHMQVG